MTDTLRPGRVMPFQAARDPVNLPVLRRWCDAMGVANPVFTDPEVAARTRLGRIVSPLSMLDVWTKPGLAYVRNPADPQGAAFQALDREGYTSAVAVSSHLEQHRPLYLGDQPRSTIVLESVTDEKATALGPARFVTTRQEFLADGDVVGLARFTVMKFRPTGDRRRTTQATPVEARDGSKTDAATRRDATGTALAGSVLPGLSLPPVDVPITATLIVAGALMTADYFEVHHDRDAAVHRGSRDIFMNIHTTLGLLERVAGDWLGPNVLWRSISVRLGAPNYPGDTMVVAPVVASVDPATGDLDISVRAVNGLGTHAEGNLHVTVPL